MLNIRPRQFKTLEGVSQNVTWHFSKILDHIFFGGKRLVFLENQNVTSHRGPGPHQCHQMTHGGGGSKIGPISVTYYLNGLLLMIQLIKHRQRRGRPMLRHHSWTTAPLLPYMDMHKKRLIITIDFITIRIVFLHMDNHFCTCLWAKYKVRKWNIRGQ